MFASYAQSVIRTLAALIVGWALSLPLAHPVLVALGQTDLSPAGKEKLVGGLVVLLSAVYYAAVHAAEKRWPSLTLLLASKVQPVRYAPGDGAAKTTTAPGVLPPDADLNSSGEPAGEHAAPDPTTGAASP